MNFTQFNKNGGVEGFCLIKTVDRKMTAKGVPYLDLENITHVGRAYLCR